MDQWSMYSYQVDWQVELTSFRIVTIKISYYYRILILYFLPMYKYGLPLLVSCVRTFKSYGCEKQWVVRLVFALDQIVCRIPLKTQCSHGVVCVPPQFVTRRRSRRPRAHWQLLLIVFLRHFNIHKSCKNITKCNKWTLI